MTTAAQLKEKEVTGDLFGSGNAFAICAALVAFAIPLLKNGIQIPIALLVISWFFTPKASLKQVWVPVLVFSSIYLFHLIGMLYTENLPRGMRDLEQKLSLLLMPLLFGLARPLQRRQLLWVLYAFCAGTVLEVVVSFATSTQSYLQNHDVMSFYMSEFSPVHHPGYVAMYMDFALAILVTGILCRHFKDNLLIAAWVAVVFVSLSLIFPASKIGLIDFGFLLVFVAFMAWKRDEFLTTNMAVLLAVALLFSFFLIFDPVAQSRIAATFEAMTEEEVAPDTNNLESNQARIIAWGIALDEIKKNPLGVGTGDINDVLVTRYNADGYPELAEKELNPHNNFMQIALAQGLPALLVFVFSLLWPFRRIYGEHNWLYAFFIISMVMHMMVESMLEKQSGVIFFAFFNALLFFSPSYTRKYLCTE